jgi:hypothetical protein
MIVRGKRPDSGRILLTIKSKTIDHPGPFMIVSGIRLETGLLGLTIMEQVGGRAYGSRHRLHRRECHRLAPYNVIVIRPARKG